MDRLVDIFFELKEKGAHNINLVTPTHYVPQIAEALLRARNKGLELPVVYNTSSYENVETLKLLDGLIDIYLPDFKYYSPELAARYSMRRIIHRLQLQQSMKCCDRLASLYLKGI